MNLKQPKFTLHTQIPDVAPTEGLHYFVPLIEATESDVKAITKIITDNLTLGLPIAHCYHMFANNLHKVSLAQLDSIVALNINVFDMRPHYTRLTGHVMANGAKADQLYCVLSLLQAAFEYVNTTTLNALAWAGPVKNVLDAKLRSLRLIHARDALPSGFDDSCTLTAGGPDVMKLGLRVPASAFSDAAGWIEIPIYRSHGDHLPVGLDEQQTDIAISLIGDLNA